MRTYVPQQTWPSSDGHFGASIVELPHADVLLRMYLVLVDVLPATPKFNSTLHCSMGTFLSHNYHPLL